MAGALLMVLMGPELRRREGFLEPIAYAPGRQGEHPEPGWYLVLNKYLQNEHRNE